MNNLILLQQVKFYLLSFLFSIIVIFYGSMDLRVYFSWLPSLLIITLSFLLLTQRGKLNKISFIIVFINTLWIIYSLFFTFSVANIDIHLKAILETLLYILVFTCILSFFNKNLNSLFKMLVISVNLFIVTALLILFFRVFGLYDTSHAFSSVYGNRNDFAFMGLVFATLVLNLPNKTVSYRYTFIVVSILSILIMLTLSSKGILGLILVFVIHIFFKYKIRKILYLIPLFLIGFTVLLFVFDDATQRLMDKTTSIQNYESYDSETFTNDSGTIRIILAIDAINIFLEHKWKGVGVNNGQFYLTLPKAFRSQMSSINSQNNLTEMLLNGGIPGFFLYYLPLIYLFYKSIRSKTNYKEIKVMIVTLILLKLILDTGMKSYNDVGHVFLVVLSWVLYYRYIKDNKYSVASHSL